MADLELTVVLPAEDPVCLYSDNVSLVPPQSFACI